MSYLWKFIILIEIIKLLIEDNSIDITVRTNLMKFLEENGYKIGSSSDLIRRIILKSQVTISGLQTSLGEKEGLTEAKYQKILPELEQFVIDNLNSNHEYYFLFDRLDDDYNAVVNSETYLNAIAYFIKQIRAINTKFKEQKKKAKLIIFLRTDIFKNDLIKKIGDANKLDEYKLEIKW